MRHPVRVASAAAALVLSLAPQAEAGLHIWSGATSTSWSDGTNWAGGAPMPAESSVALVFPAGALRPSNQNDIASLTIDSITFGDANYHLTGNSFTLLTGITVANTFSTGLSDIANAIALVQPTTFTMTGTGLLELLGVISGPPGAPIFVTGPGALTLRGANTFQGPLDVNGSTLYVQDHDGALGASSSGSSFSNGASLVMQGIFSAEPLTFAGGTSLSAASGGNVLSGSIVLSGSVNVFVDSGVVLKVDGAISGAGAPVLGGSGRLVFTALNTYAGATTDAPGSLTFIIDGYIPGDVALTSATTLGGGKDNSGNGTVGGNVSVGASATMSPGDSPAAFGLNGNASLTAGTQFVVELNGTADGAFDSLLATGTLALGGATLVATRGYTPALDDHFFIAVSGGALTGTFAGLPDGTALMIGTQPFRINYFTSSVKLTATSGTPTCELGCTASGPSLIKVATTADFAGSSSLPCASFKSVTQYAWEFGDVSAGGSVASPSHYYPRPGVYTWKMTASAIGITCTKTGTIRVSLSGDVNGDGHIDVADVFYLINSLFAGGPPPIGWADVSGDVFVNVSDVFYLINFLFAGGPAPL